MITKNMFRLAIYDVLAEYGLTRPPIADDIADAVMKIYKKEAAEQIVHPTGGGHACPDCGFPNGKNVTHAHVPGPPTSGLCSPLGGARGE